MGDICYGNHISGEVHIHICTNNTRIITADIADPDLKIAGLVLVLSDIGNIVVVSDADGASRTTISKAISADASDMPTVTELIGAYNKVELVVVL